MLGIIIMILEKLAATLRDGMGQVKLSRAAAQTFEFRLSYSGEAVMILVPTAELPGDAKCFKRQSTVR